MGKSRPRRKRGVYPWGNDFDPKKANTAELKIGDTSDVGNFSPQGDLPYSCADMIGNVWEWCNDWFDEQEYKKRTEFTDIRPTRSKRENLVFCAAARSTIIVGMPAVRTAIGTPGQFLSTSVFVLRFPHH